MSKRLVLSLSILLSFIAASPQAGIKVTGHSARGNVLAAIDPTDDSKGVRVLIEVDARPGDRVAVTARAADIDRDLRQIDSKFRAMAKSQEAPAPQVGRIYTHVFQGVSAIVPSSEIAALRALSYVRSVHTETIYQATAIDGVSIVKAPPVWTSFAVRGKGIVAAVIDSGIDYNHAAFGGGFGPGHRIAGGYDFVDNDADPMDKNGHGTHVAGILAGNGGGVTGVAPEATLMAFRVLDENASGTTSQVLAGIERAVDPNQDGDTKDHVDVINMSLGGPGNSDDLLSRAVDAATAAGVVVCIAAGNNGLDVATIDSPGNARTAITVGATGQSFVSFGGPEMAFNSRAYFSSRGPVGPALDSKPDVMAPGVSIASAKLGGGTVELSGTSMATPMVAGVAVLLRQIHPDWTPADIKGAMVSTAADLTGAIPVGETIGGGLVDAVAAANAVIFPSPAQLSFGIAGSSPYSRTLPLRLTNRGSHKESFEVHGATDFEKSIVVQPPSFTLDPGQSIDLSVGLSVGPARVGAAAEIPAGFLRFEGSSSFHVPFSVVKGAAVTVQYAAEKEFLVWPLEQGHLVQPSIDASPRVMRGGGAATMILGIDQYDLALLDEDGRIVVAEGKNADGSSTVTLAPSDARNTITTTFLDEAGSPLVPDSVKRPCADHLTLFVPFSTPEAPMYIDLVTQAGSSTSTQASDMSNRFTLFRSRACFDRQHENVHAIVLDPVMGLRSSVSLVNSPSAWLGASARFFFDPTHTQPTARLGAELRVEHDDEYRSGSIFFSNEIDQLPLHNEVSSKKYTLFLAQGSSTAMTYQASLEGQDLPPAEPLTITTTGPYVTIRDGKLAVTPYYGPRERAFVPAESELEINDGPVHPSRFATPEGQSPGFLALQTQWRGPLHDVRYYESLAAETKLFGPDGKEIPPFNIDFIWQLFPRASLQPGPYRVVSVNSQYRTAGIQGRAMVTATFDTRKEDITDPEIATFRILNGKGETRSRIAAGDTAQIVFSLADYELTCGIPACNNQIGRYDPVRIDATKLWIRLHGSAIWNPMSIRMTGGATEPVTGKLLLTLPGGIEFRSEAKLPAGYYDVRIQGEDRNGNQTDLTVEPAFAVESGRGRAVGR